MRHLIKQLEALCEAVDNPIPKPKKGFKIDGDSFVAEGRRGTYRISPMDDGKKKWSAEFTPKPDARDFKFRNQVVKVDTAGWVNLWALLAPKASNLRSAENAMKLAIKHNNKPLMSGDWPDDDQEPMVGRLS